MIDLTTLAHKLAGLFDELSSKVFKKSLDIPTIERLHQVTRKISLLLMEGAEKVALERCKKLNDATKFGFEKMEHDMEELQTNVRVIESTVMQLLEALNQAIDDEANEPIPPTEVTEQEVRQAALDSNLDK